MKRRQHRRDETPAWVKDPRELVRRLPAFQALEACGAIERRHREAGDLFAQRHALATLHAPVVVGSYGTPRGGRDVDELAQAAARRWVCHALAVAGPAACLLEALARDERPRLTESDLPALRTALERI